LKMIIIVNSPFPERKIIEFKDIYLHSTIRITYAT
jgi:hypothetical protein